MEWQWNTNGKRFKVIQFEETKRKRIGPVDEVMEDATLNSRIYIQRLQHKIDRELNLYKQQITEIHFSQCCKRNFN